mmetsp:Transcript_24420/g.44499  ORF Transcript_24420/g.44499 Transcript_24420/m.44499 type:complete len:227 (+) Transcript_24420:123-803(+)
MLSPPLPTRMSTGSSLVLRSKMVLPPVGRVPQSTIKSTPLVHRAPSSSRQLTASSPLELLLHSSSSRSRRRCTAESELPPSSSSSSSPSSSSSSSSVSKSSSSLPLPVGTDDTSSGPSSWDSTESATTSFGIRQPTVALFEAFILPLGLKKKSLGSSEDAGRMKVYGPGRFFFKILNICLSRPKVYLSIVEISAHIRLSGFLHFSSPLILNILSTPSFESIEVTNE